MFNEVPSHGDRFFVGHPGAGMGVRFGCVNKGEYTWTYRIASSIKPSAISKFFVNLLIPLNPNQSTYELLLA